MALDKDSFLMYRFHCRILTVQPKKAGKSNYTAIILFNTLIKFLVPLQPLKIIANFNITEQQFFLIQ